MANPITTPPTRASLVRGRSARPDEHGGLAPTTYRYLESPVGRLLLVAQPEALTGLFVADHDRCPQLRPEWTEDDERFVDVSRQLGEYFAGARTTFDVALHFAGTSFQVAVWSALRDIPYGDTMGYAELARRVGKPTAARAVGAANGRNPISIIVPCHRVIGADGSMTGYGWGTERKAWLLDHERGIQTMVSRPLGRTGAGQTR
jgi:O-6-methylguanine DNA methyltransferase